MTAVTPSEPAPTTRPSPLPGRLLAVGMLLLVVAIGAGIAIALIAMTSADDSSTEAGWNTLVAVDRQTGDVTMFDENGERIDRFSTDIDEPLPRVVSASHITLEGSRDDREAIAIIDVTSGDVTSGDLRDLFPGDRRLLQVRPIPDTDEFLVAAPIDRGTAYVVTTGFDIIDVADEARWDDPLIYPAEVRATPDGTAIAISNRDPDQSETAIISLADREVTVVDGNLLTLSNGRLRTAVPDEGRLDVTTFDLSGEQLESFEIDSVRVAIDASNGDLITASGDGEIVRWDPDGGSERLGRFDSGEDDDQERTFAALTRTVGDLLAIGVGAVDGEVLIIGADGEVFDGIEIDGHTVQFGAGRRCLPVTTDDSVAIIDVASGDVLAEERVGGEFRPPVVGPSDDGCTVFAAGDDEALLSAEETIVLPTSRRFAGLSGDGSAYATRVGDGNIEVRGLGADPAADVELQADRFASIYFLRR